MRRTIGCNVRLLRCAERDLAQITAQRQRAAQLPSFADQMKLAYWHPVFLQTLSDHPPQPGRVRTGHDLDSHSARDRPEAAARWKWHAVDRLQCFEHVPRDCPAALMASRQAAFAEQRSSGRQMAQFAGRTIDEWADEVLCVVAKQECGLAVRWEWRRDERGDLIWSGPDRGVRIHHLDQSV
jgi:hypothetical protein